MDCKRVREKLLDYLEGEVPSQKRKEIKAHLKECSRCNEEVKKLKRLFKLLDEETIFEPGEAFWRDFPKRVYGRAKRRRRVPYIPILAAASLLILISGLLLWRGYIHREPQLISEPLFPADTLLELMIVAKNREEIEELILQEMAPKTFNLLEEEIEESDIEELINGLSDKEKLLLCEELKKIKGGGG